MVAEPKVFPQHVPPETGPDWAAIHAGLIAPFPAGTVKKANKGKKGTYDYIDARDVMDRLDAVVGPGDWADEYRVIDLATGAIQCTLTIFGISKADVGYPNNPIGAKDKSGNPMSDEPLKDAYSDALKRAAVKWGIARPLYQGGFTEGTPEEQTGATSKPKRLVEIRDEKLRYELKGAVEARVAARNSGESFDDIIAEGLKELDITKTHPMDGGDVRLLISWVRTQTKVWQQAGQSTSAAQASGDLI